MEDELLKTAEVAQRFRVSVNAVNKWVRDGDLDAIVLPGGTTRRYRRSDIERLLAPPTEPAEASA